MDQRIERTEYGLYFATLGTDNRHHLDKGWHTDDIPRLVRRARGIMRDMHPDVQSGTFWKLHGGWSTGLEIWEFAFGDHECFTHPDRLLAFAAWGDTDLTPEEGFTLPPKEA